MAADGGGGSMVLMSSGAGRFPHRWLWAYGMAKAGIESLCAVAAEELGRRRASGSTPCSRASSTTS